MRDLFIADAHLRDPQDLNYRKLLEFLDGQAGEIRTLYLLGDIFEFWIGRGFATFLPYQPLLDRLKQLRAAGTDIVYVEGNHDFYLAPYFAEKLGCTILPDGGEVTIDGKRVFLTHGDQINPADVNYHRLRRFLRSGLIRFLSRVIPPDMIWRIATWGSRKSSESREGKTVRHIPLELLQAYARPHFDSGCQVMVSGHHHEAIFQKSETGTLVALGDWITDYSYAVCENGEFRLETYSAR